MLTKVVDLALAATFLAVHVLSRLRDRLQSTTPAARQEHHLMAEWIEADKRRSALYAEIHQPTVSRLFDDQNKLLAALKAAGDKCHVLVVKLRRIRKSKRPS
jgi:hypothetical protein